MDVKEVLTAFHAGAVYFRKTNPPRDDWARDHRVAVEDGHTLFRHWVPWNAVEVAPGVFDWSDYDRQMDLAAETGIHVILAEMLVDSPEWLIRSLPHARVETRSGDRRAGEMHISCATGGHHALCLDNTEVEDAATRYLAALAERYRDHPALLGYDIWNECSFYSSDRLCHCPATQRRFRAWLRERYESPAALGQAWHRLSVTTWDDVELSRQVTLYPDVLDGIRFQLDNAFHWMRWRRDVLKRHDPEHLVVAHGNARSFADIVTACGDDWRAAEVADVFGYTYYHGTGCNPFLAGDLIRSASRGKLFWRAEAVGDSQWSGRRLGSPRPEMDAMSDPENIRLDCLTSMACGATAYQNPRWRPLLDGPLFGSFGWYGMDGSRTARSEIMKGIAQWAHIPEMAPVWRARPMRGEVALLIDEDAQAFAYTMQGNTEIYARCVQGAYQAFLDANIQCDFARLDDIGGYPLLYVPFPVALSDRTVAVLREWVAQGGTLLAEACFGYLNDRAHALPHQPNRGFADVFGCTESGVSFGLDRMDDLVLTTGEGSLPAGLYRQTYTLQGGTAAGWTPEGAIAVVDHTFGKGRSRLVGSMPGYGYYRAPSASARAWYAGLLAFAGRPRRVIVDRAGVTARLWQGDAAHYLWVLNTGPDALTARVEIDPATVAWSRVNPLRGPAAASGVRGLTVNVPGRDAAVFEVK